MNERDERRPETDGAPGRTEGTGGGRGARRADESRAGPRPSGDRTGPRPDGARTELSDGARTDLREERRRARRGFLKATGALLVTAGLGAGCRGDTNGPNPNLQFEAPRPRTPLPHPPTQIRFVDRVAGQYPAVPDTPAEPPPAGVLYFFSLHEAQTVEALTARLLPGTPDDPGAREAGVVNYIDNLLAYPNSFAEPTYREPPFAETYEGDVPPGDTPATGTFSTIWVPADEIERYGYQSILTPRDTYRAGLASVDRYAQELFGSDFVALSEEQQDQIVQDMADGNASGFDQPTAESFFHVLRRHTAEGMFSDPAYGGNRDMVGWRLIGYPGAQRAYTEGEIRSEGTDRPPQTIGEMHRFHAGQAANDFVVLPVSGSEFEREDPR